MDAPNHTLYVARLNRIMVVDTLAGRLIAEIGGLQHAHGIALDLKGQYGYITDGGTNCVFVFERASHKIVATIPAGKNPDSIVFEPTQQRLFVFNGASKNATVIDAVRNKVIATVPLPGKPEFSTTDGAGQVFVNIEEPVNIVRLDARSMQPTATWAVEGCEAPTGMAIDVKYHRLFSACDNKIMFIIDSNNGRMVANTPVGDGPDAVAFDPSSGLIFSSNGESGDLTVTQQISADKYQALQIVKTRLGGRTLAFDESNHSVYIVSSKLGPKPAPSKENPKARPTILPGSFFLLVFRR